MGERADNVAALLAAVLLAAALFAAAFPRNLTVTVPAGEEELPGVPTGLVEPADPMSPMGPIGTRAWVLEPEEGDTDDEDEDDEDGETDAHADAFPDGAAAAADVVSTATVTCQWVDGLSDELPAAPRGSAVFPLTASPASALAANGKAGLKVGAAVSTRGDPA